MINIGDIVGSHNYRRQTGYETVLYINKKHIITKSVQTPIYYFVYNKHSLKICNLLITEHKTKFIINKHRIISLFNKKFDIERHNFSKENYKISELKLIDKIKLKL